MADRGPVGRRSGSPRADGFRLHRRRVLSADDLHPDGAGERALLVDRHGHAHPVAEWPGLEIVHSLIGKRHLDRPGWRFCFWLASRFEFRVRLKLRDSVEFRARLEFYACLEFRARLEFYARL